MKQARTILVSAMVFLSASPLVAADADVSNMVDRSRAAIKTLGHDLKQKLQATMKASGPVSAVETCNIDAPAIAQQVSQNQDAIVRRTSLKVRNPDNAPDQWELQVLLQFEKRKEAGEEAANLEFFDIVDTDEGKSFRYMKAIPTGGLCTTCHGTTIGADLDAKIKSLYPADQARGFVPGDLRGAFSVQIPLE